MIQTLKYDRLAAVRGVARKLLSRTRDEQMQRRFWQQSQVCIDRHRQEQVLTSNLISLVIDERKALSEAFQTRPGVRVRHTRSSTPFTCMARRVLTCILCNGHLLCSSRYVGEIMPCLRLMSCFKSGQTTPISGMIACIRGPGSVCLKPRPLQLASPNTPRP